MSNTFSAEHLAYKCSVELYILKSELVFCLEYAHFLNSFVIIPMEFPSAMLSTTLRWILV
jgi:hypothetical protein